MIFVLVTRRVIEPGQKLIFKAISLHWLSVSTAETDETDETDYSDSSSPGNAISRSSSRNIAHNHIIIKYAIILPLINCRNRNH